MAILRIFSQYFLTVSILVALTASVLDHVQNIVSSRRESVTLEEKKQLLEEDIDMKALQDLTKSNNVSLQRSALEYMLEKTVQDPHLTYMITLFASTAVGKEHDRLKACKVLLLVSRKEKYRSVLVDKGVLPVLISTIADSSNNYQLVRHSLMTLHYVFSSNDSYRLKAMQYGLLPTLFSLIQKKNCKTDDIIYWTVFILNLLSLSEECRYEMIQYPDVLIPLVTIGKHSLGNHITQKFAFHSVVRLINAMPSEEAVRQLKQISNSEMIGMLMCSLKTDDQELICWTLGLIHELAAKDISRDTLCQQSEFHRLLFHFLESQEASIVKIALRILKFLSYENKEFQAKLILLKPVKRIIKLMKSSNSEIQYWSTFLFLDFSMHAACHPDFLELGGMDALANIVLVSRSVTLMQYIADILGYLCGAAQNLNTLLDARLIEMVINFIDYDQDDLKSWGIALLYHLVGSSCKKKKKKLFFAHVVVAIKFIDADCFESLFDIILHHSNSKLRVTSTKSIVIMTHYANKTCRERISSELVLPLSMIVGSEIENYLAYEANYDDPDRMEKLRTVCDSLHALLDIPEAISCVEDVFHLLNLLKKCIHVDREKEPIFVETASSDKLQRVHNQYSGEIKSQPDETRPMTSMEKRHSLVMIERRNSMLETTQLTKAESHVSDGRQAEPTNTTGKDKKTNTIALSREMPSGFQFLKTSAYRLVMKIEASLRYQTPASFPSNVENDTVELGPSIPFVSHVNVDKILNDD